jgi:hypothetical protein
VESVVSPEAVQLIRVFKEKVRNWRVVGGLLSEETASIWEEGLEGLSKDRVEGLLLVDHPV